MQNLYNEESLFRLSNTIDDIGNVTLGIATIVGFISIDVVLICFISKELSKRAHSEQRDPNADWNLFFLTNWYMNSYNSCHHHHYRGGRQALQEINPADFKNFLFATVGISFLTTIASIILALHLHLFTLALVLASVWGAALALKGLAYTMKQFVEWESNQTPNSLPIAPAEIVSSNGDNDAIYVDIQKLFNPSAPSIPHHSLSNHSFAS